MENIINLQTKLQSAKVANNRLNEESIVESQFQVFKKTIHSHILWGEIEFMITFLISMVGRETLTNINLTIKQGDKVSLVGVSGVLVKQL